MTAELSIIIPTFNRRDSLKTLLQLLQQQENISLEIIVVDQNKGDFFTPELIDMLSKVTWLKQDCPNASLARNNGFKNSYAKHVLFLDDDLLPDNDFCKRGLDVFADHTSIKCFVPLVYSQEGKNLALLNTKKKVIEYCETDKSIFSIKETLSAAVFFERNYFERTGGFDTCLFKFAQASEDVELFLRMLQRKLSLWFVPYIEIFHDETIIGGCEMRTSGYWATRKKNARAMAFRYRIHNKFKGNLKFGDIIQLLRSFVINKKVLKSGINNLIKEMLLLIKSVKESKIIYNQNKNVYAVDNISFLK